MQGVLFGARHGEAGANRYRTREAKGNKKQGREKARKGGYGLRYTAEGVCGEGGNSRGERKKKGPSR